MDFFTGQILPLAINYAPKQTAFCQGQNLPINQNQALFSLLGTSFGGNGIQNFNLPNTGGRTLVHAGMNGSVYPVGTTGGAATHTLALNEMPGHNHPMYGQNEAATSNSPVGGLPAAASAPTYGAATNLVPLTAGQPASAGSGQPHNNMQPYTALNFAIVLYGIYPSRS